MKKLILTLLWTLSILLPTKTFAQNPEPYAVLSEGNTVLTFYYNNDKAAKGGMSVGPFTGNYDPNTGQYVDDDRGWYDARESITTVEFDESFKDYTDLTSTAYWFNRCHNLSSIKHIEYLKTGKVEDMMAMFYECSSLSNLDVTGFDTGNAVNLQYMFYGCDGLTSLDVSGFNTSKVQIFFQMFAQCTGLASLDVSGFNTESAVYMNYMFSGCSSLTALDVSLFKTGNVTDMGFMFNGCSKLTALDVSGFDTGNVTSMEAMFANCSGLTSLDVTKFNTEKVTTMYAMFYGCSSLTELNLQNFKTANVKNLNMMFQFCSGLTSIDVSGFNTGNAENISQMFCKCSGLTSLDLSNFNTEKVTKMSAMFSECSALTSINLSSFNTSAIADIYGLFNMFYGCSSLTTLDLSSFNTSTVDNMTQMFFNCGNLETIYVGDDWTTENVTSSDDMFTYCYNLKGGQETTYDAGHIDAAYAHIDEGATNPGYLTYKAPVDNWVTNGDFEGNDYQSFGNKKNGEEVLINVVDADIVVDDDDPANHCLHIISDGYGANYAWDNQFFIRLRDVVPVGSTVKLSLRAKASEAVTATIEAQAAPFTWLSGLSSIDITPQWNTSVQEFVVGEQQSGFQTYAIHLAVPEKEIDYYFDDIVVTVTSPSNNEPYAVLSEGNTKLTFYYDTNKSTTPNAISVGPFENSEARGWNDYRNTITSVVFESSFADYSDLTSTAYWFYECENLTSITGISNLKTDNVTSMSHMFYFCSSLTSINVSSFKTENVTDMRSMFQHNQSLTSLDVTNFDTRNVEDMGSMFDNCSALTTLDLSKFNTSKVKDMSYMFVSCTDLEDVDVSNFDTKNVTTMRGIFYGCSSLQVIDISSFNTSNVTSMRDFFYICPSLVTIYVGEGWSTESVTDGLNMFYDCQNLLGGSGTVYNSSYYDVSYARIDGGTANPGYFTYKAPTDSEPYAVLSGGGTNRTLMFYYDTNKVARGGMSVGPFTSSMTSWFDNRADIKTVVIDASMQNCDILTSTAYWFWGLSNLTAIEGIQYLNTQNVTDMSYMFYSCSSLTNLNVSNFNTQNVTDMCEMFYGCSSLTNLNVSNFNTQNVTNMGEMFYGCSSLTNLNVSNFNTQNVTNMSRLFYKCSSMMSLDVTGFNTQNVTNMRYMFYGCSSLTGLNVSGFNTANVTDMRYLFSNCSGLTILDLSSFATEKLQSCGQMFYGCSNLTTIYVGGDWSTVAVENGDDMFAGCYNLKGGQGTEFTQEHTGIEYAHIDGGASNPGYLTDKNAPAVAEPYAVLDGNVLVFYYDTDKNAIGGMDIGPFATRFERGWNDDAGTITKVEFDESFAQYTGLTSTAYWFFDCNNLVAIDGLENLKTDEVTSMREMFMYCDKLTSLNLSSFNTTHVHDMSDMFYGCESLTILDLSSFYTLNVTDMSGMFFKNAMTVLDLSSFNTANVTNMMGMFRMCPYLTTIYVSDGWITDYVTNGNEMFMGCPNLKGGQGTEFTQAYMGVEYAHIDGGASNPGYLTDKNAPVVLDEIMAYGVLTDQMKKMTLYYDKNMASHTEGMTLPWGELLNGYEYNHARETLVTIDIDPSFANFNTLESSGYIFAGCMKLTAIHGLQYFVTDHMTKMQEMFASCESLTELDLSSFNTSHVTEMFAMFQGCSHLKTIIVGPGWTTAALTDEGHEMFAGCTSLVGEKGTTYSEPNFNADYAHIDGGPSNPGYLTGTGEQIITEFEVNGIVYRVRHQQSEHQVMVAHVIHAEEELYVPSEVPYANIHWHVTALAEKAFTDLHETKAIDIPESIDSISVDLFNHCPHLAAITWRTNVALTAAAMGEFNNPNLLLFLPDVAKAPTNVTNVVDLETRIAEKIVLTDAPNGGNDFYCPEPVKATLISYTHSYNQATKIGTCQGWESIVVPFDVETYIHETKGEIYPIASLLDEQIEYDGDKPFWLYEFTHQDEFVEADQIRANRPYIISMPNDPDYWDSYILTGQITFIAKNAEIYPTHEPMVVESKSRVFVPNYANADYQNPDVFLLNVGDAYDGHLPGSVFSSERPNRIARPFEAYFVPTGNYPAKRYMDIFDTEVDAIREIPMAAKAKEGIYDLTGRKVEDGQLTKGVYIIDGKKVMVK